MSKLKSIAFLQLGIFTLSISLSTTANSNRQDTDMFNSSTLSEQSAENIREITQRPRAPQQPRLPQRPQQPRNADTTTLIDGTVVNTQQLVDLGNTLYHDTSLSTPAGQSCASCHDMNTGFDDPNSANPSSIGADQQSFGTRNAPTTSYSAFIPPPRLVLTQRGAQRLVGGLFIDGRSASLEEQAKEPFLNPAEMGNNTEQDVITKIAISTYATEFELLFGDDILLNAEQAYNYVADAIAAFERSAIFAPFSARFDQVQTGSASFTDAENRGLNIFNTKGQCQVCHDGNRRVFSNFTYINIGVPSNPQLPAFINDPNFIDFGLGAVDGNIQNEGKFRVPTLRNIAKTPPYMHNGVFATLREVIEFYNTRDTTFSKSPEVSRNMAQGGRLGELNLSINEIDDLIVFLETLSDE
jgi:cytochrome c peroxidase